MEYQGLIGLAFVVAALGGLWYWRKKKVSSKTSSTGTGGRSGNPPTQRR